MKLFEVYYRYVNVPNLFIIRVKGKNAEEAKRLVIEKEIGEDIKISKIVEL